MFMKACLKKQQQKKLFFIPCKNGRLNSIYKKMVPELQEKYFYTCGPLMMNGGPEGELVHIG